MGFYKHSSKFHYKRITLICKYCGKQYEDNICYMKKYKNGVRSCCSWECSSKFKVGKPLPRRAKRIKLICQYCGKVYEKKLSELKLKGSGKFCSRSCTSKSWIRTQENKDKTSASLILAYKEGRKKPTVLNKETRKHISQVRLKYFLNQKLKAPFTHQRWGNGGKREDLNHYVRSGWEANVCRILNYLKIPYQYEPKAFVLNKEDGTQCTYTPDLKLNCGYIEIKGIWRERDIIKNELFKKQYPDIPLQIIEKNDYVDLFKKYRHLIPVLEGRV